jgi:hypothetical protein
MTSLSASVGRFVVALDADTFVLSLKDRESGTSWVTDGSCVRFRTIRDREERDADWYWGLPDPSSLIPVSCDTATVQSHDTAITISLENVPVDGKRVSVHLAVRVEDDRVRFESEVEGVPEGTCVLVDFPYRLGAFAPGDSAALVLPRGAGIMVDGSATRSGYTWENLIYSGGQNGWSMPIWGITRGNDTLCAYARTPYDCYLIAELNHGTTAAYSAWPSMLFDGNRLKYTRRVDYTVEDGDYGALARWYRSELQADGRYRTLEEKAEGHPQVHDLAGAVVSQMPISFIGEREGRRTPESISTKAHAMGFDRLVAYASRSWHRCFQGTHAIPPGEGTHADLAHGAQLARDICPGYTISVYDNLFDMWPETPGYDEAIMVKQRDGSIRGNFYHESIGSISSTVCSAHHLEIAQRDLPALKDLVGAGSIYFDVSGAIELTECFDEHHPLTREDDARCRSEMLNYVRDLFGTVATESMPMDCLAEAVDVGAYFPVYQFVGYGCSDKPMIDPPVVPIPLYALIYHGSVLNMTAKSNDYYACDSLYVPLWGMLPDDIDEFCLRVSRELRDTSFAALNEHRFLTPPAIECEGEGESARFHTRDIQLSRYSDGMSLLANFSHEPFTFEGHSVGPYDWVAWRV